MIYNKSVSLAAVPFCVVALLLQAPQVTLGRKALSNLIAWHRATASPQKDRPLPHDKPLASSLNKPTTRQVRTHISASTGKLALRDPVD
jgi:hypothetical protein